MSPSARSAPSVSYPFGRNRVLGRVLLAVGALGACALLAWAIQGVRPGADGLLGGAAGVWLAACAAGLHFWRGQPAGAIHWDGESWEIALADPRGGLGPFRALSGVPGVFIDLQSHLWVQVLVPPGRRSLWLWVAQSSQPERWLDVRRAVYSRAKPGVDPDAIAPAGSRGA